MDKNEKYRSLPKVDALLARDEITELLQKLPRVLVNEAIAELLDRKRREIKDASGEELKKIDVSEKTILSEVIALAQSLHQDKLRPLVNAAGVVIHTNLGRSVLSREISEKAIETACRYSNLEFDLESGKRGSRYSHLEDLICRVTGAEAAHVVNNNAAAVILVLSELASGKKVPVSRGELVEIGGSFRIPEIMKLSGCRLIEIGCTNKTHLSDYEAVIDEETAMILKVHSSNYKISGFSFAPSLEELSKLARESGLPLYYDIGSGSLIDMKNFKSFSKPVEEPTVAEALRQGADIVSFSGDKLLGSVQAGIIVGKKEYIERMKKNQLTRALRIDKLIISILEQTFRAYLDEGSCLEKIPTLRLLSMTKEETGQRAEELMERLNQFREDFDLSLIEDYSEVGGGSLPETKLESIVVAIKGKGIGAEKILKFLRNFDPPIIARVNSDRVILDPRCLLEGDAARIAEAFSEMQREYGK